MLRFLRIVGVALLVVLALVALSVFVFGRGMAGPEPLPLGEAGIVLDDVVLIEPDRSRREHRRLVVEGGRIARIEPARGEGQHAGAYVLPGLIDAHAHLPPAWIPGQSELFSFVFLRHGVTSIRVPADVFPGASLEARAAIAAGEYAGPRIETCGYFVDGPNPVFAQAIVVTSREEGIAAVARLADEGVDCIKAYNELDGESLAGIREEAERRGLPVIGHVPYRLTLEDAHLDDVQHMFGFHPRKNADPFESLDGWFGVGDDRVDEVIAALERDDAAMTTSLVAGRRIARSRQSAGDPDDVMRRWLAPWYADALWAIPGGINPGNMLPPERLADLDRAIVHQARIVPRLYRAGVDLRAGTDTYAPPIVPGAALHEELALFVEGGLTPGEALAIATRGSAGALHVPGLGTLQEGAPADLLVFAEDPTRDLAALDTLLAVVQGGRVYSREALDAQAERYREHFDGFFQQSIAVPLLHAAIGQLTRLAIARADEEASAEAHAH